LIPWLLLFVAIFLFGKLNGLVNRIIFVLVLVAHYGIIMIFLMNYSFTEDKGWTKNYVPSTAIIWYLAGQIIIWLVFLKELIQRKSEKV